MGASIGTAGVSASRQRASLGRANEVDPDLGAPSTALNDPVHGEGSTGTSGVLWTSLGGVNEANPLDDDSMGVSTSGESTADCVGVVFTGGGSGSVEEFSAGGFVFVGEGSSVGAASFVVLASLGFERGTVERDVLGLEEEEE